MSGPLGMLPGMTFDPSRNRYFPTPPQAGLSRPTRHPPPLRSRQRPVAPKERNAESRPRMSPAKLEDISNGVDDEYTSDEPVKKSSRKRRKVYFGEIGVAWKKDEIPALTRPRRGLKIALHGSSWRNDTEKEESLLESRLSNMTLRATYGSESNHCHGESITSFKSFAGGSFMAATDHGIIISKASEGDRYRAGVCGSGIIGLHHDIPRAEIMAISGGYSPHGHVFKGGADIANMWEEPDDLAFGRGDIFSMSSFDEKCVLGRPKSVTVIDTSGVVQPSRPHKLPSDPLALHLSSRNTFYAGLRSSTILLDDLRSGSKHANVLSNIGRKAVVGIKRLDDSGVPWGLVASLMNDELLLFDVRFASRPISSFEGHVNHYRSDLGLCTSPDDRYIFAAGSDNVIRCWSLASVRPVEPPNTKADDTNPLARRFDNPVRVLEMDQDWGLYVVHGGSIERFEHG